MPQIFYKDWCKSQFGLVAELASRYGHCALQVATSDEGLDRKMQNTWQLIPGNIHLCLTYSPDCDYQNIHTPVLETFKEFNVLKYLGPNDFYINGKKAGGILIYKLRSINIIGLGINVNNAPEYATSIKSACKLDVDIPLSKYVRKLVEGYRKILK